MKGAEKIFIHGEEIAKQKELIQAKQEAGNMSANAQYQANRYTDKRIASIPEPNPNEWVETGYDVIKNDPTSEEPITYTVEPYGSGYGFSLRDDGRYHADNEGIDNSYAMCKVVFTNNTDSAYHFEFGIKQVSEQGCDYGMVSFVDTEVNDDQWDESNMELILNDRGTQSPSCMRASYPHTTHFVILKYRKDGGTHAENEEFSFAPENNTVPHIKETKHLVTRESLGDLVPPEVFTIVMDGNVENITGDNLTVLNNLYKAVIDGKAAILNVRDYKYEGLYYIDTVSETSCRLRSVNYTVQKKDNKSSSYFIDQFSRVTMNITNGEVSNANFAYSSSMLSNGFLDTVVTYEEPFIPTDPGEPASKFYVDSILGTVNTELETIINGEE